jgi:hypothetical protein
MMSRWQRLGAFVALVLAVAVVGTALALRAPRAPDQPLELGQDPEESPPSADALAHAAERLEASGYSVSDELLSELAGAYGVGGAVRVVAWSADGDTSMDEIRAMRDGDGTPGSVMGWGQIAKELGVHPGIGSVMGQGGEHGQGNGPPDDDE